MRAASEGKKGSLFGLEERGEKREKEREDKVGAISFVFSPRPRPQTLSLTHTKKKNSPRAGQGPQVRRGLREQLGGGAPLGQASCPCWRCVFFFWCFFFSESRGRVFFFNGTQNTCLTRFSSFSLFLSFQPRMEARAQVPGRGRPEVDHGMALLLRRRRRREKRQSGFFGESVVLGGCFSSTVSLYFFALSLSLSLSLSLFLSLPLLCFDLVD